MFDGGKNQPLINILCIGGHNCGKTSLVDSYKEGTFITSLEMKTSFEVRSKDFEFEGKPKL